MKNIAIVPNIVKDRDLVHTKRVINIVKKFNANIMVSEKVASDVNLSINGYKEKDLYSKPDLVIVLGGDGTLLNTARQAAPNNIPILGINLGQLGFLVELENRNLEDFFEKLFSGDYTIDSRMMIEAELIRNGKRIERFTALNDIVVTRGAFSRIINLNVFVDNQYVDLYPADGIVAATPTGSTAYSLSAGGPIVDPDMSVIILTPICPHTLHSRSIIIPDNKTLSIHIEEPFSMDAMVTMDGQQGYKLQVKDIIEIKKAPYETKLLRISKRNFYGLLRQKMTERRIKE